MTNTSIPTLETDRLILRSFRSQDLDDYAAIMADPKVMLFMGGVQNRDFAWRGMAGYSGQWVLDGFGFFAVEEKASRRLVGRCGPHQPSNWPSLEVGWTFSSTVWGNGYATEAASAAMDWIFAEKPSLQRIISLIDARNTPSQAVAKRLGESLTGEVFVHPTAGPIDIWAVSRADWQKRGKA